MKYFSFLAVCVTALALQTSGRAQPVFDGIRAVVNGRAITQAEVEEYATPAMISLQREFGLSQEDFQLRRRMIMNDSLDQLIERQLILSSFEKEGYRMPDGTVDQMVQERIRESFGDRTSLMKKLQLQNMTFEQFRQQVRDQYIVSVMRNQHQQRNITVSPHKIESYYLANLDRFKVEERVKLRSMAISKNPPNHTNAVEFAHEIRAKIKDAASFAEQATLHGQSGTPANGGDWGWIERSVPRKEIADAAFALAPGQVSDVLDTGEALHLLFVEDKKPAQPRPLAEVRAEIEKTLHTEMQAESQKRWVESLKSKHYFRVFPVTAQ